MDDQYLANLVFPMRSALESLARSLQEKGVNYQPVEGIYDAYLNQTKTLVGEIYALREEVEALQKKIKISEAP